MVLKVSDLGGRISSLKERIVEFLDANAGKAFTAAEICNETGGNIKTCMMQLKWLVGDGRAKRKLVVGVGIRRSGIYYYYSARRIKKVMRVNSYDKMVVAATGIM